MDTLSTFIDKLDSFGYLIIGVNLLLMLFVSFILKLVYKQPDKVLNFSRKVLIFSLLNMLIILSYGYFRFFQNISNKTFLFNIIGVLAIVYFAYLAMHIAHGLVVRYYGKKREINGEVSFVCNYQTRLLSIFSSVFISVIALVGIIRLLGFDSVLEAGGVIGVIGVFLALTSSIWGPDIFHGLINLNSDMLSEGDIIQFHDNELFYGKVHKTKVFHTIILNILTNHRVMIRNSKLRDFTVHNLSKFASARGLREYLGIKVSYETPVGSVKELSNAVYEAAKLDESIFIEDQYELEYGIKETGDHAVEWLFYYHTKDVVKLLLTRQRLLLLMLEASMGKGISLSTPITINNS